MNNGKLWSSDFIVSIQCHLPQDTKAGLLSVDVKLIFFSSFVVSIADSLSWNLDMNSRNPSIVVASRYRVFSENPSAAPTVEPTSEPSSDPTFHPTIMPMSSHFFLSPSLAPISLAPTLGDYWWWWASSRSSRSSSSSWYNGTGVLDFYKSVSTDGLKSTAFTGRLEEAASRLMLTGAGFLSGHLDNW